MRKIYAPLSLRNTDENRPGFEVADIFRLYGPEFHQTHSISTEQAKVMRHICQCRTAELGGHIQVCSECGYVQNSYNSCRDRHCPKCQTLTKEKWLNERKSELLPCGYFHNVFTLPHNLNALILCNKRIAFQALFAAANETLRAFAKDPQWRHVGRLGFIAVLHTWSQLLLDHFHLHCVIPAGVISFNDKEWKPARKKKKYLFKNQSVAKEFKRRYLAKLKKAYDKGELIFPGKTARFSSPESFRTLLSQAGQKKWVVYAKRPFAGPEQVLEYLGRYTHRVAISNNRIKAIDNAKVTFTYRDRRDKDTLKEETVPATEFIRRFLLHVLPNGFMKIRYFGFLAHTNKGKYIPLLRKLIDPRAEIPVMIKESIVDIMLRLTGIDITLCPECQKGRMRTIAELPRLWQDST
jgi:predicted Zn-ribbon and HTH transcriptional regulator